MKQQDRKKLQDAWRKTVNSHPTPDTPIENGLVSGKDGKPMSYRQFVEANLASKEFYQAIDDFLTKYPGVTLDQLIKKTFSPKNPGLKP